MNKIIKLVAIAIIAVFAAVSCSPDVSLSGFDWETANSRHDPANNGRLGLPDATYYASNTTVSQKNGKITIYFPREADFFKADVSGDKMYALEDELKKFVTVHSFEKATASNVADTLGSSISYKLFGVQPASGSGNENKKIVTIELERDFTTQTTPLSNLVVKINGQNYTYANGFKMDVDQNGVGGEAGYDDLYKELILASIPNAPAITSFVKPGDKEWTVTLSNTITGINSFPTTTATETSNVANYVIATLSVSGASTDMYDAVGALVANGFKLQKFVNGNWADDKTATYDSVSGQIRITDVNYTHNVAYRHYWSGTPLTTTAEYYGVKQRIRVLGGLNAPTVKREQYERKIAYTGVNVSNNDDIRVYATAPKFSVWSSGVDGRNATLRVAFESVARGGTYYGITEYPLSAFQGEDAGFKVVRSLSGNPITAANVNDGDFSVVNITKVEFKAEHDTASRTELNILYITIDPTIDATTIVTNGALLINEKIKYTCTAPDVVFGDRTEILRGGYKAYDFNGDAPANIVGIVLTANDGGVTKTYDSNVYNYTVSYNTAAEKFYSLVLTPTGSVDINGSDRFPDMSNITSSLHYSFATDDEEFGVESFNIYVNSGDFKIEFKLSGALSALYEEFSVDTWEIGTYDSTGAQSWAFLIADGQTINFWGKKASDVGSSGSEITPTTTADINLSITTLHDGAQVASDDLSYIGSSVSYNNNTGRDVIVTIKASGGSNGQTFGLAFNYTGIAPTE